MPDPGPSLLTYDRGVLINVLVYHWRTNISGCGCGWGDLPAHLGLSHAAHVADVYEASLLARKGS